MFVDFNILNQLGSPSINSNTFANRPAAGQTGRLFVSTDTFEIYRDNGTTWDLIGGPGSSTITGTGTATQVAYFTSSQAIGSSANLFWDNTNTRLGIGTATPGAALDIHSTGIMAQLNSTSATANSLLAFQRSGSGLWRIGDVYNGGPNYFELYNTVLGINAMQVFAATNKTSWQATENYTSGVARGNYFDYNLTLNPANPLASPNAISAVGASLDLTLEGSITIPSGARSGLDAYNSIRFTTTGTLTHNQGTQIRAYSNLTAGWAFNGSATGTITHLAGLRALFPDNTGSAVTVTNNYALLLNDQTANTGTVTYTNRWGVYQEGASDLNYFAANTLIGTTVNAGYKLDVSGTGRFTSLVTISSDSGGSALRLIGRAAGDASAIRFFANNNSTQNARIESNSSEFEINSISSLPILFKTADTTRLTIASTGAATFSAATQDAIQTVVRMSGNNASSELKALDFKLTAGTPLWTISTAATGTDAGINIMPNGSAGLSLAYTGAATFSSTIQATGVNIGTASPVGKLSSINTGNANTPSNSAIWLSSSATATADGLGIGSSALLGYKWIQSYDGALALNPAGNSVLIGTTTDAGQKLQVNGSTLITGNFDAGNTGGNVTVGDLNVDTTSTASKVIIGRLSATASDNTTLIGRSRIGVQGWQIDSFGAAAFTGTSGSIQTSAPNGGTSGVWKLGIRVAAVVALDATQYIEVDIGGTLYKLAIVT